MIQSVSKHGGRIKCSMALALERESLEMLFQFMRVFLQKQSSVIMVCTCVENWVMLYFWPSAKCQSLILTSMRHGNLGQLDKI
jgi:hypothetical protein